MSILIKPVNSFLVASSYRRTASIASRGMMRCFLHVSRDRTVFSKTTSDIKSSPSTHERLFPEEGNVLYDSKCSVCKLEMEWLANRDKQVNVKQSKLKLTDLEDPAFDAKDSSNGGIDYETGMAAIYVVTADGKG
ncbi:DUF393 domain containing protein [Nitzschia inconspicua]|uniref:DUF393 domain containing protein n=1 Tax=Nitzschia inconspicua TaxID=303405 RepID=A0A9K3Q6G1_9STRA|nr:DUF393 domain containing protein [Nitzschia inconspicua]